MDRDLKKTVFKNLNLVDEIVAKHKYFSREMAIRLLEVSIRELEMENENENKKEFNKAFSKK